jgi:hypothetical protein
MNYEKEIIIDEHFLDKEWIKQSQNYLTISQEAIQADTEAKRSKECLEVVKAELYLSIRKQMEEEGEKITETLLDNRIKIHADYKNAMANFLENQHAAQILKSAVQAFDQKKSALENLVKLKLAGYYSEPKDANMQNETTQKAGMRQKDKLKQRRNSDNE